LCALNYIRRKGEGGVLEAFSLKGKFRGGALLLKLPILTQYGPTKEQGAKLELSEQVKA